MFTTRTGIYGTDYLERALVTAIGLGANRPQDAVYPTSEVDADGKPYSGANKYVMHFDKGQMPPVNAFWSLTMYNAEYFFVANPLNRYTLSARSTLKYNADGSVDLYIQNETPGKDKEANWLPAPEEQVHPDAAAVLAEGESPVDPRRHVEAAGGDDGEVVVLPTAPEPLGWGHVSPRTSSIDSTGSWNALFGAMRQQRSVSTEGPYHAPLTSRTTSHGSNRLAPRGGTGCKRRNGLDGQPGGGRRRGQCDERCTGGGRRGTGSWRYLDGGRRVRLGESQADTERPIWRSSGGKLAQTPSPSAGSFRHLRQARTQVRAGRQVATQSMAHDALGAHARDELGHIGGPERTADKAALASAASFTAGGRAATARRAADPASFLVAGSRCEFARVSRRAWGGRCTYGRRVARDRGLARHILGSLGHGHHGRRRCAIRDCGELMGPATHLQPRVRTAVAPV